MRTIPALLGEYADRPTLHVGKFASARFFEFECENTYFLDIIEGPMIINFYMKVLYFIKNFNKFNKNYIYIILVK